MKVNISAGTIIGGIGCALGMVGIGMAIGSGNQMKEAERALDASIHDMIRGGKIDIPDSMIQESVNRVVGLRTNEYVRDAISQEVNRVRSVARKDIESAVNEAVGKHCSDLEPDVKRALNKALEGIDISKLRDEAVKAASDKAAEKFDEDLKRVADNYASELQQVNKIYKALAGSLGNEDDGRTIKLKLS